MSDASLVDMRTRIVAPIVFGCLLLACDDGRPVGPSADQQSRYAESRAELDALMREIGIPGLQVALIVDGEVMFRDALGVRSTATGAPMTTETTFLTGSMIAKILLAEALLQMEAEGRVDLGAPVLDHLPWLPLEPISEGVTLRQLLSMRSGIWSRPIRGQCPDPSLRAQLEGDGPPHASTPPGEAWLYTNYGYGVGAAVLEAVEGRPWTEVVRERVESPLGLSGTNDTRIAMTRDHSMTHSIAPDGTVTEHEIDAMPHCAPGFDCSVCEEYRAGAGYHASADDMARMVLAFMHHRAPFDDAAGARATDPVTSPGYGEGYAYGYGTSSFEARGEHWIQAGSEFGGVAANTFWIPARRFGVILIANAMGPSIAGELAVAGDAIATRFLDLPAEPPDLSTPSSTWSRYVGRYASATSFRDLYEVTQSPDGSLRVTSPFWDPGSAADLLQGSAWPSFPAIGGDTFHYVDPGSGEDTDVTFFADSSGVVRHMASYGKYLATRSEP